jgi:tetratricopeptide (TPR) repeat protein
MTLQWLKASLVLFVGFLAVGCAMKVPLIPAKLLYPDYMYPVVPSGRLVESEGIDRGWRFLQNNRLRNADREFNAMLSSDSSFYPALTGVAYVALAQRDISRALEYFDSVLGLAPEYPPALVGRGQTLLILNREREAIHDFEIALSVDDSLVDIRRRLDVLRFRLLQKTIDTARLAVSDGRFDDARDSFKQALESSPETAFLHRELGMIERRQGDIAAAVEYLRRAVDLDPTDVEGLIELGESFEIQGNYVDAETALQSAFTLAPSEELSRYVSAIAKLAADSRLPVEFRNISEANSVTRGDVAALIGVRLGQILQITQKRQVVITDTANHWARQWIAAVTEAGVMEPYANHAFQPDTEVQRVDLALVTKRLLDLIIRSKPELTTDWVEARPLISDIGTSHLRYPAIVIAIASGVMPLLDGDRFNANRPVSGIVATTVIERVLVIFSR